MAYDRHRGVKLPSRPLPQFVEEFIRRRRDVKFHRGVVPPPSAIDSNLLGSAITHTASTQLARWSDPASNA
jgi:hypothetical protein